MSATITATAMVHPVQAGPARFSIAEFQRMMGSGALEDMWLEFVDGELQRIPPPAREHGRLQLALIAGLLRFLPAERLFGDVAIGLVGDTIAACDALVLKSGAEPAT